jgi:hypothetical protein
LMRTVLGSRSAEAVQRAIPGGIAPAGAAT